MDRWECVADELVRKIFDCFHHGIIDRLYSVQVQLPKQNRNSFLSETNAPIEISTNTFVPIRNFKLV